MFGKRILRWFWLAVVLVLGAPGACRPRDARSGADESAPAEDSTPVEEHPTLPAEPPAEAPLNAQASALKVNKSALVAVLGYHDFTTGKSANPMVINIQKFHQQMQAIKDAKLHVISLDEYLAWRRGEKSIPDPALMITIDDGWKSTHTLALPVLKEFGYPFTAFIYKNYVNGGGRALTTAEIQDLMAGGATIGSHSVSHPFPGEFKRRAKGPPEEYAAFVEKEFKESKEFLEALFGIKVTAFAYPGGYYTPEMAQKGRDVWGYDALFTCNGVRTTWDTPLAEVGRFIVYGNDPGDRNFKAATSFHGAAGEELGRQLLGGEIGDDGTPTEPLVVVKPAENETITERRPLIEVDLSKLQGVVPASVSMRIPGFGLVPATYNPDDNRLTYRPLQKFRSPEVSIHVRLRRKGEEKDDMVSWKFFIDQMADYVPAEPVVVPAPTPPGNEPIPATGKKTP